MSKLIITGERFIPESEDVELELEHLERYSAVLKIVKEKRVLDAACGEGYGSNLMATAARSVVGIDIDEDTIANAKQKYGERNNLSFVQGSVAELSFVADKSIDVVVSFETIEHIDEELQKAFLEEVKRVLADDGILIMSSPNKKEYTDRYGFHNKFHIHELYIDEFMDLLHNYFDSIVLYRQYLEVASFIDRADIDEDLVHYRKNRERYNPEGKYVIAVAGNGSIPQETLTTISLYPEEHYLCVLDAFNDYKAEIANNIKLKDEELERRAVELDHRMETINSLEAKRAELENDMKLANEELDRRAVELEHRMQIINRLEDNRAKLENDIELANEELERRAVELEHRMEKINEVQNNLDEYKNKLKLANEELERRAVELEKRMDVINGCQRQIEHYKSENLLAFVGRKLK